MKSKTVNGRRPAIASLVCAALALAVAPAMFGPLGVIAGMVAVWKGDVWWGAAGVSGSAVAAVVGYWWAEGLGHVGHLHRYRRKGRGNHPPAFFLRRISREPLTAVTIILTNVVK